jgi:hypothetical protein
MAKKSPTKSAAKSPAKLAVKRAAANDDGASSESTGVKVFQIHFKGEQANHLYDAFTHYDNAGVESETHEFAVFQKLHQSPLTRGLRHWGAVEQLLGDSSRWYMRIESPSVLLSRLHKAS